MSVQLALGVRFDGHGLMSVNGPLTEMLENDRTALPLLRTVTASDVAAWPGVKLPKSIADGRSSTTCWVPVPESEAVVPPTEKEPVRGPGSVGAKASVAVQLEFAAIWPGHVVVKRLKSPLIEMGLNET